MKLVKIDRGVYETPDKRFHVAWQKMQGARSCYRVLDRRTETSLRAFNLDEVRDTIRDMLANDLYLPVRIPNEGENIARRPAAKTEVYLAVREVRRRLMGSREEGRFEAELYVTVAHVSRPTRVTAREAAIALAHRRGWVVNLRRLGWATRDAAHERALAEDARDLAQDES